MPPEPVIQAVEPQGVQPGVAKDDFERRARSRIVLQDRPHVLANGLEKVRHSQTLNGNCLQLLCLVLQAFKQDAAQVSLTIIGQHDHDQFAGIFRTLCDSHRS